MTCEWWVTVWYTLDGTGPVLTSIIDCCYCYCVAGDGIKLHLSIAGVDKKFAVTENSKAVNRYIGQS